MKNVRFPIFFATLYLLIYTVGANLGWLSTPVVATLWLLSPVVVGWMAYRILKYGVPSGHTFDDQFYEDYKPN